MKFNDLLIEKKIDYSCIMPGYKTCYTLSKFICVGCVKYL